LKATLTFLKNEKGLIVTIQGNWGTEEQRQKTLGKMGKGKTILVKQGVSTDRSAPGLVQIIAEIKKFLQSGFIVFFHALLFERP